MAGDWIKIEHGILGKPEVMRLCDLLDCGPHQVVGHLVAFWLWCDVNMSSICPRVMGTKRGLDAAAGRDGFCDAMIAVGWMSVEDGEVWVPNYETHLSKSAKQRAGEQRKKALQRSGMSPSQRDKAGTDAGTNTGTQSGTTEGTKPGLEKRREEKSIKTPLIPQGGDAPTDVPSTGKKPKRTRNQETVGEWLIPQGWDSERLRDALGAFERMRASIGHRIKDRANLSRVFKSFDNAEHLIYAIDFATSNEYQGIKPDYRPPITKPEPKKEKELPMITELPPEIVAIYTRQAEERRKRNEEFERKRLDESMRRSVDLRDTEKAV